MSGSRLPRLDYLVGSIILTAIVLGLGWGIIYYYAILPLVQEGPVRLAEMAKLPVTSAIWWRHLIALGFDVLVIVIGVVGTWWVTANLLREAPEAGKWRIYYKSEEGRHDVWVEKLTVWQRFQHFWVLLTFTICAITGFAMMGHVLADRQTLMLIHVTSGIAMGALMLVHAIYYGGKLLAAKARGEPLRERFPMLDIYSRRFLRSVVRVLLGKSPEPYDKYDVEQLFEYWGVYWGMLVLGIPGVIMLLYGNQVLGGILWTTHVKEAVLAVTFILMVHLGYTHFRPKIFPMDPTWLYGKVPLRRILEEHPRWAERLKKLGIVREEAARPAPKPAEAEARSQ